MSTQTEDQKLRILAILLMSLALGPIASRAGDLDTCPKESNRGPGFCKNGVYLTDRSFCESCVLRETGVRNSEEPEINWNLDKSLDEKFQEDLSETDAQALWGDSWKSLLDYLKFNTLQGDQEALAQNSEYRKLFLKNVNLEEVEKTPYLRARWLRKQEQRTAAQSEFKKKLDQSKSAILQQAKAKGCANGVRVQMAPVEGFLTEEVEAKDEFSEYSDALKKASMINKSDYTHRGPNAQMYEDLKRKKIDLEVVERQIMEKGKTFAAAREKMKGTIEEFEKRGGNSETILCSPPFLQELPLAAVPKQAHVDLKNEDFFEDNETALSQSKIEKIVARIKQDLKPSKPGCKKIVKSVNIQTSSSRLANTGKWGTDQLRFNFKELSQKRAESLKELLVAKGLIRLNDTKVIMDANGKWGDGTSGDCPYTTREVSTENGKSKSGVYEVVRKDGLDEELKNAKFARINFETLENCEGDEGLEPAKRKIHLKSVCFRAIHQCK